MRVCVFFKVFSQEVGKSLAFFLYCLLFDGLFEKHIRTLQEEDCDNDGKNADVCDILDSFDWRFWSIGREVTYGTDHKYRDGNSY